MTVRVTWRGDEWRRAAMPAINAGLTEAARVYADGAVRMLTNASPSPPYSPPGVDTGHLRRSIAYASPEALGTPGHAAFGTAVEYGRHLEFGAIVRPKSTKYLPVPVDRALAAKIRRAAGPSLRGYPGLKYIPPGRGANHGGRLVLAKSVRVYVGGYKRKQRTASAGKTAFVLKKQVVIQPRPWIVRTAYAYRTEAAAAYAARATDMMRAAGVSR